MPYSPPPTPPRSESKSIRTSTSSSSPISRSSLLFSSSRYSEILTKFPSPPQGRNSQNQIGLFPAIYTLPSQFPNTTSDARTQSPEPSSNTVRFSSESEGGVYEGLGIRSDQVFQFDQPLASPAADLEETVANLSIKSSASSILSSEIHRHEAAIAEESVTEDDSSSASSQSTNPILAQIRTWTPEDVAAFMIDRGYPKQAPNFIRHEISGAILLELDLMMLKEVDIIPFGIRFGIMREIDGLKKLAGTSVPVQRTRSRDGTVRLPARSPSRESHSEQPYPQPEETQQRSQSRQTTSPKPRPHYSLTPSIAHYRRSSYDPSIPRSQVSPRPQSVSPDLGPNQASTQDPRASKLYVTQGHRSTRSTDSGFSGSNFGSPDVDTPPSRRGHFKSNSVSVGTDGLSLAMGRVRVDSQDSGLGHSRHTSAETIIRSPVPAGHKRQSSSLATVRVLPPSIPLMEAVGQKVPGSESPKDMSRGTIVLPGTRSETALVKPTAKFLITPNILRSPQPDKSKASENGVRLVKSYSALRRRSSDAMSPTPSDEPVAAIDLHHHRSVLLKNIPAKEAAVTADYCGWLKKRTERGTSIAGITAGPGTGIVGGWKRRWFVLKGRRLSYYHSEKVRHFNSHLILRI